MSVCVSCQAADLREILQPRRDGHRHPGRTLQEQRGHLHEAGGERLPVQGLGPGSGPCFHCWESAPPSVNLLQLQLITNGGSLKSAGTAAFEFKNIKKTLSHLLGVFKESKLRKVYSQRSAGGPDAAGVEVSPSPSGKCLFLSQGSGQ